MAGLLHYAWHFRLRHNGWQLTNVNNTARRALVLFDLLTVALVAAFASFALPHVAYAYVDPSVMTYTIQAVAGVAVALAAVAGVALRRTRRWLVRALGIDENARKDKEQMADTTYQNELKKIKAGEIDGQKIQTMTIIIKATNKATYKNVIDALDEMQICSVGKYVLDKISPDDAKLLKSKGINVD